MSTSSRRTYRKQPPALPGLGATSAASPGPSATKRRSSLGELYAERTQLSRLVPPDLSHQLDHVRRQSQAVERDIADLYDGTGRWAHTSAGQAARAVREAALERQRAEQLLESPDLGRWSRHKARRALAAAGDRFDKALAAWENTAGPYATRLEGQRARLGAEVAQLEQARTSREEFLAQHPEVPNRLAELDRAIARGEDNRAPAQLGATEGARARTPPRHFSRSRPWLRHRTVTAQIGMVLVGARGFGRSRPNIAPGTGLGQSAPLGGGLTNNARLALLRPSSR